MNGAASAKGIGTAIIWKAAGGRWAYRAPERVAEELAGIPGGFVYFADDHMFFDRDRMAALYRAIKDRGIRKEYFLFSRADAVVKCRDLIPQWAELGLRQVFLGLETVDVEQLKPLNKRTTAATNEEAIRLLMSNGIDPLASFMVFPEFVAEDFDRVYDYVERLGVYYCEYSVLTPAPGSDLYHRERDRLTTHDYRMYDYMHPVLPTRLSLREFYRRPTFALNMLTVNKAIADTDISRDVRLGVLQIHVATSQRRSSDGLEKNTLRNIINWIWRPEEPLAASKSRRTSATSA